MSGECNKCGEHALYCECNSIIITAAPQITMSVSRTNRYQLFSGDRFYPLGGYDDVVGTFDSILEAQTYIDSRCDEYSDMWAHIVQDKRIIMRGTYNKYDREHGDAWHWEVIKD